jgi:ATP-dependent Clp protease ATP-binding subunit ClpC
VAPGWLRRRLSPESRRGLPGLPGPRLLGGEAGLHVLDYEDAGEAGRAVARVTVTPTPLMLPRSSADQQAAPFAALEKAPVPSVVVRRYRLDSSPLVRDLTRGWRTGRVDLVFGGNFDVIGDVSSTG